MSTDPIFADVSNRLASLRADSLRRGFSVNSPIPSRHEVADVIHDADCPAGVTCPYRPHADHSRQAAAVLDRFDVLRRVMNYQPRETP
jgi:hypothetical protein